MYSCKFCPVRRKNPSPPVILPFFNKACASGKSSRGHTIPAIETAGTSFAGKRFCKEGVPSRRAARQCLAPHCAKDNPPYDVPNGRGRLRAASCSLLDRARPVFSFSARRKRENGGCSAKTRRASACRRPRPEAGKLSSPPRGRATPVPPPWGGFRRNIKPPACGRTQAILQRQRCFVYPRLSLFIVSTF